MTILLDKMSHYDAMSGWAIDPVSLIPVFTPDNPVSFWNQLPKPAPAAAPAPAPAVAPESDASKQAGYLIFHQKAVLTGPEPTTAAGYLERGALRASQVTNFLDPAFSSWQLLAQQDFDKAKALTLAVTPARSTTGASSSMLAYYAIAGLALAGGAFYFLKRR
jgi:LPXTG-motif cell wall-anchored protein